MKKQEELNALKEEIKVLNKKLAELTDEELKHVTGGEFQPPVHRPKIPYRITYENPEAYIALCICPYCGRDFGRSDLEYFHEPECPQNPANIK